LFCFSAFRKKENQVTINIEKPPDYMDFPSPTCNE